MSKPQQHLCFFIILIFLVIISMIQPGLSLHYRPFYAGNRGPFVLQTIYHIHIINGFTTATNGSLQRHCKSDERDFGPPQPLGQNEEFKIPRLSIRFSPHITCEFRWLQKHPPVKQSLQVSSSTRFRCDVTRSCYWKVTEDGFYFSTDNATYHKACSWHGTCN